MNLKELRDFIENEIIDTTNEKKLIEELLINLDGVKTPNAFFAHKGYLKAIKQHLLRLRVIRGMVDEIK